MRAAPKDNGERCGDCKHWDKQHGELVTPGGRSKPVLVAPCLAPVPVSISRSHQTPMYATAGAGCACFAQRPVRARLPKGAYRSGGNNAET